MKHDAMLLDGTPSLLATWKSLIILSYFHISWLESVHIATKYVRKRINAWTFDK